MTQITSMTGYRKNDMALNGFNQKVEVLDVSRGEIVFVYEKDCTAHTMSEDEFDMLFTKVGYEKEE